MSAEEAVASVVELYAAILQHQKTHDRHKRRRSQRSVSDGELATIRRRYAQGISQQQIARELGRNQNLVWYHVHKMGLKKWR